MEQARLQFMEKSSISQIEKAGAFENLKISPEKDYSNTPLKKESFLKKNWHLVVSVVFILLAFISQNISGEDSTITIALYVVAIIIGGFSLFKEGISNLLKFRFYNGVTNDYCYYWCFHHRGMGRRFYCRNPLCFK